MTMSSKNRKFHFLKLVAWLKSLLLIFFTMLILFCIYNLQTTLVRKEKIWLKNAIFGWINNKPKLSFEITNDQSNYTLNQFSVTLRVLDCYPTDAIGLEDISFKGPIPRFPNYFPTDENFNVRGWQDLIMKDPKNKQGSHYFMTCNGWSDEHTATLRAQQGITCRNIGSNNIVKEITIPSMESRAMTIEPQFNHDFVFKGEMCWAFNLGDDIKGRGGETFLQDIYVRFQRLNLEINGILKAIIKSVF